MSCVTIPKVQKIWKGHHYWYILFFKLNFYSKSRFEFINQNLNWKPFSCAGGFDWKAIDIDPWIKMLRVQNFHEVVIKIDSSRFPKWCFSVTTISFPSWRSQWAELLLQKQIRFKFQPAGFLNQSPVTPKNGKFFLLYWLLSIFNLIILDNDRPSCFHQGLNRKLDFLRGIFK